MTFAKNGIVQIIGDPPIKLEVGKYYLNRLGNKRGPILRNETNSIYKFIDKNTGASFTSNGHWHSSTNFSLLDLIIECSPDGTPIKAKADRRKRKWYVVMECPSRESARWNKNNIENGIRRVRVVADLDLEGEK